MNERRVLIVDDSLTIRRLAERVLRQEGFLTDTAESIAETIVKVPLFRPDIILLDYVLPDGVGTDACRALLASPATESIPVVLISAKGGHPAALHRPAERRRLRHQAVHAGGPRVDGRAHPAAEL